MKLRMCCIPSLVQLSVAIAFSSFSSIADSRSFISGNSTSITVSRTLETEYKLRILPTWSMHVWCRCIYIHAQLSKNVRTLEIGTKPPPSTLKDYNRNGKFKCCNYAFASSPVVKWYNDVQILSEHVVGVVLWEDTEGTLWDRLMGHHPLTKVLDLT